jgi:hypothetical protein
MLWERGIREGAQRPIPPQLDEALSDIRIGSILGIPSPQVHLVGAFHYTAALIQAKAEDLAREQSKARK